MATTKRSADSDTHGAAIKALVPGEFVTLENRLPAGGALQARKMANGAVKLYWRFTHNGKTAREEIGLWDSAAPPKTLKRTERGWAIAAALRECERLGMLHADNLGKGGLAAVREAEQQQHQAEKVERQEKAERTLAKLVETYVAYLKTKGRRSFYDAKNLIRLHLEEPFPKLAAKPAADLTVEDVLDVQRRLIAAGKGRTANKLRSYLRAAYQCAIDVRSDASIPEAFRSFKIVSNPVSSTKRLSAYDRADKNPLKLEQLRAYWQLLKATPGAKAAALRLHLLTGGQRIEQLVRLKTADTSETEIRIFDAKGRPGQAPRPHAVPLLAAACDALKTIKPAGEYAISTTGGERPISSTTLQGWARSIVGDAIPGFQLKRVRSGVETALAGAGVGRDVRGQLQSHGLTGVQAKHYDAHDYLPEKRAALEKLLQLLEQKPAEIVHLPHRAA
jgi:integrase